MKTRENTSLGACAGEMLDIIADPEHPDHDEVSDWLEEYDPHVVDELPVRYALSRIANRHNAARSRLAKNPPGSSPT